MTVGYGDIVPVIILIYYLISKQIPKEYLLQLLHLWFQVCLDIPYRKLEIFSQNYMRKKSSIKVKFE